MVLRPCSLHGYVDSVLFCLLTVLGGCVPARAQACSLLPPLEALLPAHLQARGLRVKLVPGKASTQFTTTSRGPGMELSPQPTNLTSDSCCPWDLCPVAEPLYTLWARAHGGAVPDYSHTTPCSFCLISSSRLLADPSVFCVPVANSLWSGSPHDSDLVFF